jgi:hypothetical protein
MKTGDEITDMIISKLALLHPHTLFALQKAMPLNET